MSRKVFLIGVLCLSMIGTGLGCGKPADKQGSGIYYYGIDEIYKVAKNVYIGKLTATGNIVSVERRAYPDDNYVTEYRQIHVVVEENFKGDFQRDQQVDDLLYLAYDDFLEVGATYLFMTGVDYNSTGPIYRGANIYDAVKILDADKIIIYNLDKYKKTAGYRQNDMGYVPKDLKKIRTIFNDVDTSPSLPETCPCNLTDDRIRDLLSDPFYDPSGLYCEKHGVDNANRFNNQ